MSDFYIEDAADSWTATVRLFSLYSEKFENHFQRLISNLKYITSEGIIDMFRDKMSDIYMIHSV